MSIKPTWEVIWIDSESELEKISAQLKDRRLLSVDTETSGWQTGNEKLCLIQIGDPDQEKIYLVDALEVKDLSSFGEVLNAIEPGIIAHNAPFEERQFARHGIKIRGIIDTLKMAKQLRPDLPSRTLKSCCKFILDVDLSKEEQTSDWEQRPLSEDQFNYAALDAEVTYKLYEAFAEMEAKLEIDSSAAIPELMRELYEVEKQSFTMIKDIAAELEVFRHRKEMLREAIRNKLIDGEDPYQGEYGDCSVQRIKRTEVNPEKVRDLMPEIAEEAIVESVPRQRLKDLIEEHGVEKDLLDQVIEIIRYDNRLKLNLADF